MQNYLKKLKNIKLTIRTCILSIFIIFTLIMVFTLKNITHTRFKDTLLSLAFELMDRVSFSGFTLIERRAQNTEVIAKNAAELMRANVVNPDDLHEVSNFFLNIMIQNTGVYSAFESIFWQDKNGNQVFTQKNNDLSVTSTLFSIKKHPHVKLILQYDSQGKFIKAVNETILATEENQPLWYQTAKQTNTVSWINVYHYPPDNFLGVSVATPVTNAKNLFIGAITINIRLDYLRHLIESIHLSPNGFLFIITSSGKMIAFPYVSQYQAHELKDINEFQSYPWVINSFYTFQHSHEKQFYFNYKGVEYLATYRPLPLIKSDWLIATVAPVNDFIGEALHIQLANMLLSLSILIIGIVLLSEIISRFIKPLKVISNDIEKIRNFDLEDTPIIRSNIKEISNIANEVKAMKLNLRSFQKYVPASLVRELIETGEVARVGGSKKNIAILFSDIENFTPIAERMSPDLLTKQVCEYFDALSLIIIANNGTIDKYIGDAIMTFWGAPHITHNTCEHAARTALSCLERSEELNQRWRQQRLPLFITRMGIHSGEAIIGNFGSSERLNYTAIGDTINLANRLVGINKIYGTKILVTENVFRLTHANFVLRYIDSITVKGKAISENIYELLADEKFRLTYDIDQYKKIFARGFQFYQHCEWDKALVEFAECLKIYPEDTVAIVFMNRINNFKIKPPPSDWKGIWNINEK